MIKLTDEFLESELEWKPQNTGSGPKGVWAMGVLRRILRASKEG